MRGFLMAVRRSRPTPDRRQGRNRHAVRVGLATVVPSVAVALGLTMGGGAKDARLTAGDRSTPPSSVAENVVPVGARTAACESGTAPMTREEFTARALGYVGTWPGVTNPKAYSVVVTTMEALRQLQPDFNKSLQSQIPALRPVFVTFIRSDTPISPPRSRPGFKAPVLGTTVAFVSDCGGDTGFTHLFARGEDPKGTIEDLTPRAGPVAPVEGLVP